MSSKCPCCLGTGKPQDPVKLGESMRAKRRRANLTLAWMAKQIGITKSHLSCLENGKRMWQEWQVKHYERL